MSNQLTMKMRIAQVMRKIGRPAHIKEIAEQIDDKPESTVRGRIYSNLDKMFKRVAKGVYWFVGENEKSGALVIEGNGRDLSMFEDGSVDAIITDHPWEDPKSNKGGSRNFDDTYDKFRYSIYDFHEKARVLKEGSFLVEIIPAENENNFDYLYQMKKMAEKCGLYYYAKVPWKKGNFVSNTGRKSKNTEDVLFFTKGKPRNLRPDNKKIKNEGGEHYMSGTSFMLPTSYDTPSDSCNYCQQERLSEEKMVPFEFDYQPTNIRKRIHQAEKPVELYEAIIEAISIPGELIIDQFAGSGNMGVAAIKKNRFAILFEILEENIQKMCERLSTVSMKLEQSFTTV